MSTPPPPPPGPPPSSPPPPPPPPPPPSGPPRSRPRTLFDELIVALARPRTGLLLFVLGAGLVSLGLGQDAGVDLRSWHYYNPWAFLHRRAALDVAPAGLQTFRNPLPDLAFYALAASGLPAWIVAFLLGLPAGVGAYFFYRIARRVVVDLHVRRRALALAATCLVAFTGTAALSQVGSASSAWLTAALVLPALFVLVREGQRSAGPSRTMLALAGLLLGLAAGLSLGALPYLVAAGVATLACLRDRPGHLRAFAFLAVYGLLGFLLGYGYWGAWLWGRYYNPFFPYLNGFFQSPYWDPVNLLGGRFRPQAIGEWLTWPLLLAERNRLLTAVEMREPRLAALALLALAYALATVLDALREKRSVGAVVAERVPRSVRMIAVFTATAYAAWLPASADYRGTVPAELLASLLLVVGAGMALQGARHRDLLVGVVCAAIVVQTAGPGLGRLRAGGGPYLDVAVPLVTPDALVLATAEPVGYLVPFLPPGARVLRLPGPYRDPPYPNRLHQLVHDEAGAHAGPLFVLRRAGREDADEDAMLAGYGLGRLDRGCAPVRSNLETRDLEVCPLERR